MLGLCLKLKATKREGGAKTDFSLASHISHVVLITDHGPHFLLENTSGAWGAFLFPKFLGSYLR